MRKSFLFACAAVLVLGYAASSWAQCASGNPRDVIFAPAKANKFQASLIQAMTSCTLPDTATGGGTPACSVVAPISTRFAWCEGGSGLIKFKTGPTRCVNGGSPTQPDCALNPTVGSSGDIFISLKLKKVCWGSTGVDPGQPVGDKDAPVTATVQLLGRPTLQDDTIGVVQVIDFPAPTSISLAKGNATVRTSVNALLSQLAITSLSTCTIIEPVDIAVLDDLGGRFATPGTYLGKGN